MNARPVVAALAAALLAPTLAACGPDAAADQPGNPAVYSRINNETDCAILQTELDTASAAHDRAAPGSGEAEAATGYMRAADARMRSLGCY